MKRRNFLACIAALPVLKSIPTPVVDSYILPNPEDVHVFTIPIKGKIPNKMIVGNPIKIEYGCAVLDNRRSLLKDF